MGEGVYEVVACALPMSTWLGGKGLDLVGISLNSRLFLTLLLVGDHDSFWE